MGGTGSIPAALYMLEAFMRALFTELSNNYQFDCR